MKIDIKTRAEIDRMREACLLTAEVRDIAASKVAPGVTTGEIDEVVRAFCRKKKVSASFLGYDGFPGAICVSLNDEVIHGIPDPRREIQPGDLVKLDVGIFKNGFHGDTARTIAVGVTDPRKLQLVETTRRALMEGIVAGGPGVHLGDIGETIQKIAESAGFSVVREFVGHGVGRTVHEDPLVPNYGTAGKGIVLKPGMTIAIEPMINLGKRHVYVEDDDWTVVTQDHQVSAHFEHTVAVTDDGLEILTQPWDY